MKMQATLPKRKPSRLKEYNYSQNGMYFITICTHGKAPILSNVCRGGALLSSQDEKSQCSDIVGEGFHALPQGDARHFGQPDVLLSPIGKEVEKAIMYMIQTYDCIDRYVIMPNHIHLIIRFTDADRRGSLSLHNIIGRMKSFTTYKYNQMNATKSVHLWQRSFHDHVIRNEASYQEIWQYIENNPLKWELDCYHV